MPVDNLARYWMAQYDNTKNPFCLGPVMHALQDATIPHHSAGTLGNWHGRYEADLHLNSIVWVLADNNFQNDVKGLFDTWNRIDSRPPSFLNLNNYRYKLPARNWRIDMLVTWLALHAYNAYDRNFNHFRTGAYLYNPAVMKELTKKALAMSMLVLYRTKFITLNFDIGNLIRLK